MALKGEFFEYLKVLNFTLSNLSCDFFLLEKIRFTGNFISSANNFPPDSGCFLAENWLEQNPDLLASLCRSILGPGWEVLMGV